MCCVVQSRLVGPLMYVLSPTDVLTCCYQVLGVVVDLFCGGFVM